MLIQDKPEVLIVDDEVRVLKALIRSLREEGYKVTAVNTPAKALDKLAETTYHLVISDLKMPDMDGIEFLALVAELYPDTAQLLLSGHADMNALREAINKCQISQFIAKPWDTQELKSVTRQLVEQVQTLARLDLKV